MQNDLKSRKIIKRLPSHRDSVRVGDRSFRFLTSSIENITRVKEKVSRMIRKLPDANITLTKQDIDDIWELLYSDVTQVASYFDERAAGYELPVAISTLERARRIIALMIRLSLDPTDITEMTGEIDALESLIKERQKEEQK